MLNKLNIPFSIPLTPLMLRNCKRMDNILTCSLNALESILEVLIINGLKQRPTKPWLQSESEIEFFNMIENAKTYQGLTDNQDKLLNKIYSELLDILTPYLKPVNPTLEKEIIIRESALSENGDEWDFEDIDVVILKHRLPYNLTFNIEVTFTITYQSVVE